MKCKFVRAKMEYLGHIIGNNGIQTDLKKIKSVHKARPPKNRKELRSFLGLVLPAFHTQLLSRRESPVQAHK